MRDQFDTPDGIYLLSHSVGLPFSDIATVLGERYLAPWQKRSSSVWNEWLQITDDFRQAVAALIDVNASEVCPQPNVSAGLSKLLYALPALKRRQTIVLSEHAFPSLAYVFQRGKDAGFNIKMIPKGLDAKNPEVWADAIDGDTGLVLITQVHSNTGEQLPVKALCEVARRAGVISVVDTAQSTGILPVEPTAWGADCVLGSCVKWLCGGPGAGFLWLREPLIHDATPVDVGWFSHADPFEFDIHKFRYADDALRFWGGTPAVASSAIASHAIRRILTMGIETIRHHNLALTQRLIDALDDKSLYSPRHPQHRSGTVIVDLDQCAPSAQARLTAAEIQYDERRHGIRLSPHIYNSESDIDTLIDCLT
ncbi:MAG: aminotransferase class V-fold PLP-dependent enzyme [Pseudomonadota bacterium]